MTPDAPITPSRRLPTALDARLIARRRLPRLIFDFIDGGAGSESALRRNADDFDALRLMPRVLVDAAAPDLSVSMLGRRQALPFGVAPMGMCNLAWPGADEALAREAGKRGFPICVSTASSTPLERMAEWSGGEAWFQLYVIGSVDDALSFVDRAAAAGYRNLILTVDVPKLGRRPRDLRNGFVTPFRMRPAQFLDFAMHPRWSLATLTAGAPRMANYDRRPGAAGYDRRAARTGADWAFLERLRDRWKGRLIVKGVLSPEDAGRIARCGADAVYVSNHGGRQLDAAPSTIAVLPAIRQVVGLEMPLILDGGVRCGEDMLKARALGADLVMMGRPFLFAMAADGARGVASLLDSLSAELETGLAQLGLARFQDVTSAALADFPRP